MILAVADVYGQVGQRAAVEDALRQLELEARSEAGCEEFTCAAALSDPGHFLVLQRWRDQRALDAHYRSTSFGRYQAAVGPFLARDSQLRLHVLDAEVRPISSDRLDLRHDD